MRWPARPRSVMGHRRQLHAGRKSLIWMLRGCTDRAARQPVPATIGMTWIRDGPGGIPASDKEMPQRFHRRDAGPGQSCHVSHLPDTTRLFARMLFMEATVRLQVRALCAPTTCITGIMASPTSGRGVLRTADHTPPLLMLVRAGRTGTSTCLAATWPRSSMLPPRSSPGPSWSRQARTPSSLALKRATGGWSRSSPGPGDYAPAFRLASRSGSRVPAAIRGPMGVRQPGRLQPGLPLRSRHATRRVPQLRARCEGVCALAQRQAGARRRLLSQRRRRQGAGPQ